jgi:hypothetical protein
MWTMNEQQPHEPHEPVDFEMAQTMIAEVNVPNPQAQNQPITSQPAMRAVTPK